VPVLCLIWWAGVWSGGAELGTTLYTPDGLGGFHASAFRRCDTPAAAARPPRPALGCVPARTILESATEGRGRGPSLEPLGARRCPVGVCAVLPADSQLCARAGSMRPAARWFHTGEAGSIGLVTVEREAVHD